MQVALATVAPEHGNVNNEIKNENKGDTNINKNKIPIEITMQYPISNIYLLLLLCLRTRQQRCKVVRLSDVVKRFLECLQRSG